MTKAPISRKDSPVSPKNRTWTKRWVSLSVVGIFVLAFYTQNPDLIYATGAVVIALLGFYIYYGHADLKQFLSAGGIADLRKRGPDA